MSELDRQTQRIFRRIVESGYDQDINQVYSRWDDTNEPAPTRFVINEHMRFAPGVVPFMESKKQPKVDPISELFWFWIEKSNNVNLLRDKYKCKVWNQWENKDPNSKWYGTIGPAYGYQLGLKCRKYPVEMLHPEMLKPGTLEDIMKTEFEGYVLLDQVDHLLHELVNNPASRYHLTSFWDIRMLDDMMLKPCVWTAKFEITENLLNLKLKVRSNDMALGNPYNMYQYFVLLQMISQVTGYQPGELYADIDNAHYYNRHIKDTMKQLSEYDDSYPDPTFWINPEVTNFYMFDHKKDFKVTLAEREDPNWEPVKYEFPIAVS